MICDYYNHTDDDSDNERESNDNTPSDEPAKTETQYSIENSSKVHAEHAGNPLILLILSLAVIITRIKR